MADGTSDGVDAGGDSGAGEDDPASESATTTGETASGGTAEDGGSTGETTRPGVDAESDATDSSGEATGDVTEDSDEDETAILRGPAAEWLSGRADDLGLSNEELLKRLVAAYRAVEETGEATVVTPADLDSLRDDVEDLDGRVGDVESEFDEKIQDVRERVIQVKREADQKAAADHDHPDLAERAAAAMRAARSAEERTESLAADLDDVAERTEAGFENFEDVLTYLRDRTDTLDRKATTLASAVLAVRESVSSLAVAEARRAHVDSIREAANRAGVQEADCEDCGGSVTVALLTAPECPYCGATFDGVEAKAGWFGSHTLLTGDRPAIEAGDALDAETSWLGEDTANLEAMAEGADDAPAPDIVSPAEGEQEGGEQEGSERTDGERAAEASGDGTDDGDADGSQPQAEVTDSD